MVQHLRWPFYLIYIKYIYTVFNNHKYLYIRLIKIIIARSLLLSKFLIDTFHMLEHNEDQILIGLIDLYIYMIIMCVYIYICIMCSIFYQILNLHYKEVYFLKITYKNRITMCIAHYWLWIDCICKNIIHSRYLCTHISKVEWFYFQVRKFLSLTTKAFVTRWPL